MKKNTLYGAATTMLASVFATIMLVGLAGAMVVVTACLTGVFVWLLWNGILPEVLGVSTITFFQAVGISMLCGLLLSNKSGK